MDTTRIVFLGVALLLLLAGCGNEDSAYSGSPSPSPERATALIDTGEDVVLVDVEVADSPEERTTGLMNRTSLEQDEGMLFVFFEPTTSTFWMKDTRIPLSIAFIDDENRIISIEDMDPCEENPCPKYAPDGPYWAALEVNQGAFEEWGVEVGDTIRSNQ